MKECTQVLFRPGAGHSDIMYMQSEGLRWYGGKNVQLVLGWNVARVAVRSYPDLNRFVACGSS
jgi:hypothetical protein